MFRDLTEVIRTIKKECGIEIFSDSEKLKNAYYDFGTNIDLRVTHFFELFLDCKGSEIIMEAYKKHENINVAFQKVEVSMNQVLMDSEKNVHAFCKAVYEGMFGTEFKKQERNIQPVPIKEDIVKPVQKEEKIIQPENKNNFVYKNPNKKHFVMSVIFMIIPLIIVFGFYYIKLNEPMNIELKESLDEVSSIENPNEAEVLYKEIIQDHPDNKKVKEMYKYNTLEKHMYNKDWNEAVSFLEKLGIGDDSVFVIKDTAKDLHHPPKGSWYGLRVQDDFLCYLGKFNGSDYSGEGTELWAFDDYYYTIQGNWSDDTVISSPIGNVTLMVKYPDSTCTYTGNTKYMDYDYDADDKFDGSYFDGTVEVQWEDSKGSGTGTIVADSGNILSMEGIPERLSSDYPVARYGFTDPLE